jgi:hypothetical protein
MAKSHVLDPGPTDRHARQGAFNGIRRGKIRAGQRVKPGPVVRRMLPLTWVETKKREHKAEVGHVAAHGASDSNFDRTGPAQCIFSRSVRHGPVFPLAPDR